jgi:hypothetical protein
LNDDYIAFLADFKGLKIGEEFDDNFAAKNAHLDAYFTGTFIAPKDSHDVRFITVTCGPIDGQTTTAMLNNAAILHALIGENPYKKKARKKSHLFTFYNRYDGETFQGIMPDTGAAGTSIAGELQVKALQRKLPYVIINTATAGNHKVRFGNGPEKSFFGTANVQTPFGTIDFAVMLANTPFLLCLADMNRYGVYYNNVDNMLV